jgi:hypothetical protein
MQKTKAKFVEIRFFSEGITIEIHHSGRIEPSEFDSYFDALKTLYADINQASQKVSYELRLSGSTLNDARMIFGLFETRKINLVLNKKEYSPGETISGTLNLELKNPVIANRLEVMLIYYVPNEDFTIPLEKTYVSLILDGARQYSSSQYKFDLKIPLEPPKIDFPADADSILIENWKKDDALGMNAFTVKARLDIPNEKAPEKYVYIKIKY